MKNFVYLIITAFTITFMGGCSNDSDGSGTATLKITAGYKTNSANKIATVKTNTYLKFDQGYIWVSEIEFDGIMVGGAMVKRSVERFSKIDFATGVATPLLDDIIIPAGSYSKVDLGVELRDEDAKPSILMQGMYTHSNGTIIPILFEFNSGEVFEAESFQPVTVNEDETVLSKITFDPIVWFSVISRNQLDNAKLSNGVIVISDSKNESIFDLVADRLDVSTESVFK